MDNVRGNRPPLFRKMNYILMGVGALLLIIGYFCLAGGKVPDEVSTPVASWSPRS